MHKASEKCKEAGGKYKTAAGSARTGGKYKKPVGSARSRDARRERKRSAVLSHRTGPAAFPRPTYSLRSTHLPRPMYSPVRRVPSRRIPVRSLLVSPILLPRSPPCLPQAGHFAAKRAGGVRPRSRGCSF